MSASTRKTALTAEDIRAMKGQSPIVSLTAYTTPMAQLMDDQCDPNLQAFPQEPPLRCSAACHLLRAAAQQIDSDMGVL